MMRGLFLKTNLIRRFSWIAFRSNSSILGGTASTSALYSIFPCAGVYRMLTNTWLDVALSTVVMVWVIRGLFGGGIFAI